MRELVFSTKISDCEVDTFRVSGAGGRHRDHTSAGVRVIHKPSGAIGKSSESRSQLENKKAAFRRMAESQKFQTWAKLKVLSLPPIEEVLDDQMQEKNLVIDVKDNGKWVTIT